MSTETLTRPPDSESLAGKPWNVIVLNDNHNTFDGVAFALASTIPGVDYDRGLRMADRIHNSGRAVVFLHRGNISRLLHGEENRFELRRRSKPAAKPRAPAAPSSGRTP